MVCEHLAVLEKELIRAGIKEGFRGAAWGNVREWVYFDCYLDLSKLRRTFGLADCVTKHEWHDVKTGSEYGFYCEECRDGIMGVHPAQRTRNTKKFRYPYEPRFSKRLQRAVVDFLNMDY